MQRFMRGLQIKREQLPEAAELVPVVEGGTRKGTIICSVSSGIFSIDNPEHLRIANAIEVRLADQDLLPR
ncbi:Imm52 family immunity protein [Trinickia diaoshuihuensis]|uniref:Imm52 family immunity protein n=1 Tax=Trinickia diaoshuihuensis TaxID=2292265 RepID=UPI000E24A5D8|nr:Imm52 family immunity protein [Trinickia diaoshuihuensis]